MARKRARVEAPAEAPVVGVQRTSTGLIRALEGAGQHGKTVNILASQGKIRPVYALVGEEVIGFCSTWSLTDWKRSEGYYGPRAASLPRVTILPEGRLIQNVDAQPPLRVLETV